MLDGQARMTAAHVQSPEQAMSTLYRGARALGGAVFVFLPRVAPGLLALACAYCCYRLPPDRSELRRLLFWTSLVAAYPLLTTLWALDARRALTLVAMCIAITLASVLVFRRTGRLRDMFWPAVAYGIPAVVLVSLVDVALGIPIRTFVAEAGVAWVGQPAMVGKSGRVEQAAINWSMAVMALSLFPYLYATREASRGSHSGRAIRLAVVAALFSAAFLSTHQSSMLALCAGAAVYGIARWHKGFALGLVTAGWLASIAATPLAMSAVVSWTREITPLVQYSLQSRLVIWRTALNDIAAHPWKGAGVGSTRITFRAKAMNRKEPHLRGFAAHSHNWFLDLWRELGAIGAVFAALWVALIARRLFARLPDVPPELIAFTGLVLAMSTSSFSLWAPWYLCAIGLSLAMFGLLQDEPDPEGRRSV